MECVPLGRIYTKHGDRGKTRDLSGKKVEKHSKSIKVLGKIDESQAWLDTTLSIGKLDKEDYKRLERIQNRLWQLAGEISLHEIAKKVNSPIIKQDVIALEKWMDEITININYFIRFRNHEATLLNENRVRCRSLERSLVSYLQVEKIREEVLQYINRLSDYFFVLAYKYEVKNGI